MAYYAAISVQVIVSYCINLALKSLRGKSCTIYRSNRSHIGGEYDFILSSDRFVEDLAI